MSGYRLRARRPGMYVAADDATGAAGESISTAYRVSRPAAEVSLSGASASSFSLTGNEIALNDSSQAGSTAVTISAVDPATGQTATRTVVFTVTAAEGLPALTISSATALDSTTIQLAFTENAAYARYQGALNGDFGTAGLFSLDDTKQITVATPGTDYDVQIRGVTEGDAEFGPWSDAVNVEMPEDPGTIIPATQADNADWYVQRLSVNCHFNFNSPSDSNWLPAYSSGWIEPLKGSGFRAVRTAFLNGASAQSTTYLNDIYNTSGMKGYLLINPRNDTHDLTGSGTGSSSVVATTANINLSGVQTIDGVAGVAGRIVVVKNQTTASQNGVYVMASGAWSRHGSFNTWAELYDKAVRVNLGSTQANRTYGTTIGSTGTLGTTAVTWQHFPGGVCSYNVTAMQNLVNFAETGLGAEKILAFSGPNEVNNGSKYHWAERSRAFQKTFYDYVKGKAAFADTPVGLFSIYGRQTTAINAVVALGTCEDRCDFVELHNYTGARRPTEGGLPLGEGGGDGGDPNAETSLTQTIADHQALAPGKPIWVGEVGQDAESDLNPNYVGTFGITSEIAQSKYISRTPLIYYLNDIEHTSIYAWLNNWTANFHGLLNNNKPSSQGSNPEFDGPPFTFPEKMVGTTLMRQVAIMADVGTDFTAGSLAYEFTGTGANGDLIHKLFQKRSGTFYLMVHHNGVSWKRSSPVGDLNPTASVTLTFASAVTSVRWWKPHASATATDLGGGTSFSLTVPDYETILEIIP